MKNYIPENLQHLVNKLKCSRDEFGAIFELNRGNISFYINEKSQPRIETIQKICKHFNITIDDFINRSLEEVNQNVLHEPGESYTITTEESEIIVLLKNTIKDKDKIIATLEEQVMYYRYPNEKSSGA